MSSAKRIFVLDDDVPFLAEIEKLLQEKGYEVGKCPKPAESLWAMKNFNPDCLILDLKMPFFDGVEFLPWIRCHFPHLPILVCTAVHDIPKDRIIRYGVRHFLHKPFTEKSLCESLERCMLDNQAPDPSKSISA